MIETLVNVSTSLADFSGFHIFRDFQVLFKILTTSVVTVRIFPRIRPITNEKGNALKRVRVGYVLVLSEGLTPEFNE